MGKHGWISTLGPPALLAVVGCAPLQSATRSDPPSSVVATSDATGSESATHASAGRDEVEGAGKSSRDRRLNPWGVVGQDGVFEIAASLKPMFGESGPAWDAAPVDDSPLGSAVVQAAGEGVVGAEANPEAQTEPSGSAEIGEVAWREPSTGGEAFPALPAAVLRDVVPPPPALQSVADSSDSQGDFPATSPQLPEAIPTASVAERSEPGNASAGTNTPVRSSESAVGEESEGETLESVAVAARTIPRADRAPGGALAAEANPEGMALSGEPEVAALLELGQAKPVESEAVLVAAAPADAGGGVIPASRTPSSPQAAEVVAANALDAVPPPPVFSTAAKTSGSALGRTDLRLERFHLCTEILGFGSTTPTRTASLRPGKQSLAYVEVVGFASRSEGGEFETRLACQMVLEDENAVVVWQQDFGEVVDRCPARRSDFFCHYVFTMPEDLPAGRYTLRLRVMDTLAPSANEASLRVDVGEERSAND